jgi:decaprenylphospho-beta-D-erythro-pentofuranosid-2-ulose 2-reductase
MTDPPYHAAAFGATSAICIETLRAIVRQMPAKLLLIGRDADRLEAVAADLRCRGAECITLTADFSDPKTNWQQLLAQNSQNTPWDLLLIAHGTLPDQQSALNQQQELAAALDVNFVSPAIIASACAHVLKSQSRGTLAVFGSVAGDRGRGSNFIYGSAKAGIDTFLAGMRHHFAKQPEIKIITLKPGMTDSPMTAHLPKGPLFSSAEAVGTLSWKTIQSATPVSYLPGWWRMVMFLIRLLPSALFHRTKL